MLKSRYFSALKNGIITEMRDIQSNEYDKKSKLLTIIVCTYDRNAFLKMSIEALAQQSCGPEAYDVIIVDNFGEPQNHQKIIEISQNISNITVMCERSPGLSHARNTGARAALTEWIGYIDDDCMVPFDFVRQAIHTIENFDFHCFGGHISSWWYFDRPKWLAEDFGSKPQLSDDITAIHDSYAWGGNMFFNKNALLSLGGFDENVGMKAHKIGYTAENRVQIKLRSAGYIVGYNPHLKVHHLVAEYKLHIGWHLRAAFAEGRDARAVFGYQYTLKALFLDFLRIIKAPIKSTYQLLTNDQYFKQNWILDVCNPMYRLAGKLASLSSKV